MDRRKFLAIGGCCAVGLAALDTFIIEPSWLEVIERDIPLPRLPKSLHGFRIAHLSDVHLRQLGRLHDAVLLRVLEDFCRALSKNGREVIATSGNWEHWGHIDMSDLANAYARGGARLLGNESRLPRDGCT